MQPTPPRLHPVIIVAAVLVSIAALLFILLVGASVLESYQRQQAVLAIQAREKAERDRQEAQLEALQKSLYGDYPTIDQKFYSDMSKHPEYFQRSEAPAPSSSPSMPPAAGGGFGGWNTAPARSGREAQTGMRYQTPAYGYQGERQLHAPTPPTQRRGGFGY